MDETRQKIIDAAMALVRDQGFAAMTTKEIARKAGVNECTLFRKFSSKKEIVLQGVAQDGWRANITPEIFKNISWSLRHDLEMFMHAYMDRMTPDFVRLSIGLRAPQIYAETAPMIRAVPETFLRALIEYLNAMAEKGRIPKADFDTLALTFFSAVFGYTFLRASFQDTLSQIGQETYIAETVALFVQKLEAV